MRPRRLLFAVLAAALFLFLAVFPEHMAAQTAAQLLKEGRSYHGLDDTTDRAAGRYRSILSKYPNSVQAEEALFYLGTYYQKKFYILEHKAGIQDWSSFNQAEEALNEYVSRYSVKGAKFYLADAYHTLAVISIRRGDMKNAGYQLDKMIEAGQQDRIVHMYKVVWSPSSEDIVKSVCDSRKLAEATREITYGNIPFSERIRKLRDWCRTNCRLT